MGNTEIREGGSKKKLVLSGRKSSLKVIAVKLQSTAFKRGGLALAMVKIRLSAGSIVALVCWLLAVSFCSHLLQQVDTKI